MSDEHDDDRTKPDLPSGLGATEERTLPGIGPNDALVAVAAMKHPSRWVQVRFEITLPSATIRPPVCSVPLV